MMPPCPRRWQALSALEEFLDAMPPPPPQHAGPLPAAWQDHRLPSAQPPAPSAQPAAASGGGSSTGSKEGPQPVAAAGRSRSGGRREAVGVELAAVAVAVAAEDAADAASGRAVVDLLTQVLASPSVTTFLPECNPAFALLPLANG